MRRRGGESESEGYNEWLEWIKDEIKGCEEGDCKTYLEEVLKTLESIPPLQDGKALRKARLEAELVFAHTYFRGASIDINPECQDILTAYGEEGYQVHDLDQIRAMEKSRERLKKARRRRGVKALRTLTEEERRLQHLDLGSYKDYKRTMGGSMYRDVSVKNEVDYSTDDGTVDEIEDLTEEGGPCRY